MTELERYFEKFFEEKDLAVTTWMIEVGDALHVINSTAVIDAIKTAEVEEQRPIRDMLVDLDFKGKSITHYLEHLAHGMAKMYHENRKKAMC